MNLFNNKYSEEFWEQVMDMFYKKNDEDPLIGPLYAGKDANRIKSMNKNLIICALTHSEVFLRDEIKEIHMGLGITSKHFERFLLNFFMVSRYFNVPDEDLEFLLVLIEVYRDDLVE